MIARKDNLVRWYVDGKLALKMDNLAPARRAAAQLLCGEQPGRFAKQRGGSSVLSDARRGRYSGISSGRLDQESNTSACPSATVEKLADAIAVGCADDQGSAS